MKSHFLRQLEHDQIVNGIQKAEEKTTGEIRVRISHQRFFLFRDEMHFARRAFRQMGMSRTPDRNAVLIVIFPACRKMVVLGDHAAHDKLGETFWRETIEKATGHFKAKEYTRGILRAVETVGEALERHFPKTKSDPDSLPNEVVED